MADMTPVSELLGYLPHQGNMVWIDYVLSAHAEGGEAMVLIDPKKHYCNESQVRQSSFIEWIAQGFGFTNALYVRENKTEGSIKNAFLVGFNNVIFSDVTPCSLERLIITTQVTRVIGPIIYINGDVKSQDQSTTYCQAQIKLFSN